MDPTITVLGSFPALLLSRVTKTKFILDVKSTPVEVKGFSAKLAAFWFKISLIIGKTMFDGIAIVTPMMKNMLCRRFNINSASVSVWTNGVPTDLFDPQRFSSESIKIRMKLKLTNKFVVFYHGVFSISRGIIQTINAIEILKEKYPELVLFLLGSGPAFSQIDELVRQKHLEKNVIIHPPVSYEEVPKYIGISDICIVPLPGISYWIYQSPLKLMEYLGMEKTVLLTDIPAHRMVAGDEKCCLYLRTIEPLEIANLIEYALINRNFLPEWGKNGRKIVLNNFRWKNVADKVEQYFFQIYGSEKCLYRNIKSSLT
jgi:glycosyltransferase involved in cell wall biosynthesis